MCEKTQERPVSRYDIDAIGDRIEWINKRIDVINAKLRLLTRILIDKKIISPELAKSIEESKMDPETLIDWYLKQIKK